MWESCFLLDSDGLAIFATFVNDVIFSMILLSNKFAITILLVLVLLLTLYNLILKHGLHWHLYPWQRKDATMGSKWTSQFQELDTTIHRYPTLTI